MRPMEKKGRVLHNQRVVEQNLFAIAIFKFNFFLYEQHTNCFSRHTFLNKKGHNNFHPYHWPSLLHFGFVSWVNAILIPYFKIACELTHVKAYLVTFAFYISYFLMSVPASYMLKRTGFKKGMMIGFWAMSLGALIFVPAALTRTYEIFLVGLFTIGRVLPSCKQQLILTSLSWVPKKVQHNVSRSWVFSIKAPAL